MTIADQILASVAGRQTFRRAELFDKIECSENGIDLALKSLIDQGKLTRIGPGVYALPRSWPVWLTMIVPPIKRPCANRIEREKETT